MGRVLPSVAVLTHVKVNLQIYLLFNTKKYMHVLVSLFLRAHVVFF
jgi:hypothetical protein